MPSPRETEAWNATAGCTPAGRGCENCESPAVTRRAAGKGGGEFGSAALGLTVVRPDDPDRCEFTGQAVDVDCRGATPARFERGRHFEVSPHADLFHPAIPDESIRRAFEVMARHRQHTFTVRTRRPERLLDISRRLVTVRGGRVLLSTEVGRPLLPTAPHVRLGVSAEDADAFRDRLAVLAEVESPARFVTVSPMLGPVLLRASQARFLRLIEVAGEAGRGARPLLMEWVVGLLNAARFRRVPVRILQLGSRFVRDGRPLPLASFAGADAAEWPEDLKPYGRCVDGW